MAFTTGNKITKADLTNNATVISTNQALGVKDSADYCTDGVSTSASECKANGTCSDAQYTTQLSCTQNSQQWVAYQWMQWQSPNGSSSYDVMKNWEKSPRMIGELNDMLNDTSSGYGGQRPGMCICAGGWTYETDHSIGTCSGTNQRWIREDDCEDDGGTWTSEHRQVYVCHDPHVLLINMKRNHGWTAGNSTMIHAYPHLYDTHNPAIKHLCVHPGTMTEVASMSDDYTACANAGFDWHENIFYGGTAGSPFQNYNPPYSNYDTHGDGTYDRIGRYAAEASSHMVYRRLGVFATESLMWKNPGASGFDYGVIEPQKFGQAYGLIFADGDHTKWTTEYEDLQCENEYLGDNGGLCWTAMWAPNHIYGDAAAGWILKPSVQGSSGYYGFQSIDFIVADENLKDPRYVNNNYTTTYVSSGQSGTQADIVGSELPPDQQNHGEE